MAYFTAQFFSFGSERCLEGPGELPRGRTVCWQECEQQAEENGYFPPHLEYRVQFGSCQYKRYVDKLDSVQWWPPR